MAINGMESAIRRVLGSLLLLASSVTDVSARTADDPVTSVTIFHTALLDGNVGAALSQLAPEVVVFQNGTEIRSREDYAAGPLKKDIAMLSTFYVETLNQTSDVQDSLAWVSSRSRYLGKSLDKPVELFGTETVVLRRSAAGWQIVHLHRSSTAGPDKRQIP